MGTTRSKFSLTRGPAVVAMMAAVWSICYADEKLPIDPVLSQAVQEYKTTVDTAREKFLPNFDKVIGIVRNNKKLPAEESAKAISELEADRDRFITDGVIPYNQALIKLAQPYARDVDRAALKLSTQFQKSAKTKVNEGKVDEATALLKYRDKLVVGEGYDLVGHWRLAEGIGAHGYSEQYMIQKQLGQWSVERSFYEQNGRKVGASSGRDLKYSEGALSYTDHFTKKPKAEWHDKADMTIRIDPETPSTLKLRWVVGSGQSDVNTLVPVN